MNAIGVFAAVVTAVPVLVGSREMWRRTIGRRRHHRRSVEQLTVGVTLDRFIALLGPETQARVAMIPGHWVRGLIDLVGRAGGPAERINSLTESVFVSDWSVVQAIHDPQTGVIAFSVTSRSENFRPTFSRNIAGGGPVQLLSTQYEDLGANGRRQARLGARLWLLIEEHYFGNPADYLYFAVGATPLGVLDVPHDLNDMTSDGFIDLQPERAYRATSFSTYGESRVPFDELPFPIGGDPDEIRLALRFRPSWLLRARATVSRRFGGDGYR